MHSTLEKGRKFAVASPVLKGGMNNKRQLRPTMNSPNTKPIDLRAERNNVNPELIDARTLAGLERDLGGGDERGPFVATEFSAWRIVSSKTSNPSASTRFTGAKASERTVS